MKKTIWNKVLQILITVLTAIATTFGVQSCLWLWAVSYELWGLRAPTTLNLIKTKPDIIKISQGVVGEI